MAIDNCSFQKLATCKGIFAIFNSIPILNFQLFWYHGNKRHHYFLHRDTTVLECVLIIRNIIIIVVRISEEVIVHRKYIFAAQVWRGQAYLCPERGCPTRPSGL